MTTWRCPVCRADLTAAPTADGSTRSWRCPTGHSFDVAKQGHINLLITHQRRQREPGDNAEMVGSRRRFLDGGWYDPLRTALLPYAQLGSVCDVGCGEGWYTRGWPEVWGLDIAKAAVSAAAKRAAPGNRYAVASAYDIPLADTSVAVALSVFAPLPAEELARVVRPGGLVVTVTPGPEHLAGLAAELFETVEPHPGIGPFDEADPSTTGLVSHDSRRVTFDVHLPGDGTPGDLLGMTPWAWYVDAETRERVAELPHLATPVDFLVSVYRRT